MLGQGSRAIVGLKGMADDAKSLNLSPNDLFQSARLITSLVIGFLVGLAAAVIFIANPSSFDWHTLVGFASAGYLGTDFLEGFISKYLGPPPAIKSALALNALTSNASLMTARPLLPDAGPSTAKELVYKVLTRMRPGNPFDDDTALADLAFDDGPSIDAIRWEINREHWRGLVLPMGALGGCAKVKDITKKIDKAMGGTT